MFAVCSIIEFYATYSMFLIISHCHIRHLFHRHFTTVNTCRILTIGKIVWSSRTSNSIHRPRQSIQFKVVMVWSVAKIIGFCCFKIIVPFFFGLFFITISSSFQFWNTDKNECKHPVNVVLFHKYIALKIKRYMLRKAMCSVAFYRRWLVCVVVFVVLCLAYS